MSTTILQFSVIPSLPLPEFKIVTLSDIARQKNSEHSYHDTTIRQNITYTQMPGNCNRFKNEQTDKAAKLVHLSPDALTLPFFPITI